MNAANNQNARLFYLDTNLGKYVALRGYQVLTIKVLYFTVIQSPAREINKQYWLLSLFNSHLCLNTTITNPRSLEGGGGGGGEVKLTPPRFFCLENFTP